jgi:hypothetical protein
VAVPAPGAPVDPDTIAAEVALARPASPVEAVVISSEDEAEDVSRVTSPTIFDLMRVIPDTHKVTPRGLAPWGCSGG